MKEKTFKEKLIRQFNLKMTEKVIQDLKLQSKVVIHENDSKEEIEANLLGEFLYQTNGTDKEIMGEFFG